MTHTPGPWRYRFQPYTDGAPYATIQIGNKVTALSGMIDEANARLIAAAPALLEALESAAWWLEQAGCPDDRNSDVLREIKAAIALAKGESK